MAGSIKLKVETLAASVASKLPLDSETSAWLCGIGNDLAAKLAAVGLMPERQSRKLGAFLEAYIEGRKAESKPATIITIRRVADDLGKVFGADADLRSIGPEEAESFKTFYVRKGLAGATIHRRLKMARMLFGCGPQTQARLGEPVRRREPQECQPGGAEPLRHTGRHAQAHRPGPTPAWRTIIALARFAGLRCPSEVLSLKWEWVDFAADRMTVYSPKTEHLEGKKTRLVPIFAVLRSFFEDAYELAEPGEVYVVHGPQADLYRRAGEGPGGWAGVNIRTTFEKLIRRAGLDAWPGWSKTSGQAALPTSWSIIPSTS